MATKRKMIKRVRESPVPATVNSYLGLVGYGNANKVEMEILEHTF